MKLLDSIKNTRFLKDSTKLEYIRRINEFQNFTNQSIEYLLLNPKYTVSQIIEFADSKGHGIHTSDKYASCFLAIYRFNQDFRESHKEEFDEWNRYVKQKIRDVIDKKYNSNAPSERQIGAYTSFEAIIRRRNALEIGSPERLLLFMYTAIPPARNDYHNLKIYFKKPKFNTGNYVIFRRANNSCIVLNEFKTDKSYDPIVIKIPQDLYNEINQSLSKEPREYLFVSTQTGKSYNSPNSFSKWANRTLKAIFQNDISLTTLRHIYISRRDLQLESKSGLERKMISDVMGHSLAQQQRYLWHSWIEEHEEQ